MKRIFVEKKDQFNIDAKSFVSKLKLDLGIETDKVRIINIYDVDQLDDKQLEVVTKEVLSEPNTDNVYSDIDLKDKKYFATQLLPAQFDVRADSAMQCAKLIAPEISPVITTGKLYIFNNEIEDEDLNRIKDFIINKIEMKEMDLNTFGKEMSSNKSSVKKLDGFISYSKEELRAFLNEKSLAMNFEDLEHIQNYFKNTEDRNPTETEIKMLDTYWSDHCRHTTFETIIENVEIEESSLSDDIHKAFNEFEDARNRLASHKPRTLMNLATINFKELKEKGLYNEVEVSSEINACSVFANVDVNGQDRKYLIQFKNETHNHPTEIEPFGGASTCLGGAIRDPLSGRSYVYQGMRVSGAGNPIEPINETLKGKLPQQIISKVAAQGFSSYGNQIGIPATLVEEIIHPGFKAKRLEAGAVVGASPADYIRREEPIPGDIIVMIGGGTGRDGIGGATGSSKEHDDTSSEVAASEVQKGNPPEERKLQRLFSNKDFTTLVKKSNDFGAGGVSVAIGELADSLEINLDNVPLKYQGLNGHEIALSESQERMAVVISKEDYDKVIQLAQEENVNAIQVAEVKDNNRLVMKWNNQVIVDISREFIETNGVRQKVNAVIAKQELYKRTVDGNSMQERFVKNMSNINVASQKGLVQNFDNTIGNTTVLNPYGGLTQKTKAHISVQKVPMRNDDFTNTVTMLSEAYNPLVTEASPFLGGAYAIVASISKVVAYGGNMATLKFSLQEFFEKLNKDPQKWGKPLAALLGASHAMRAFDQAAIGGKDSMSGTFNELNVPPTLISFALSIAKADNIISSEFKKPGNLIYVIKHNPKVNGLPNFEELKLNYSKLEKLIKDKKVVSAWPLVKGGISEALVQMAQGNKLGFDVHTDLDIFDFNYGTIVVESKEKLDGFIEIGKVTEVKWNINNEALNKEEIISAWEKPLSQLFPTHINGGQEIEFTQYQSDKSFAPLELKDSPLVLIPVFPGTNCEYDIERKFAREGAKTQQIVFNNQTPELINKSIDKLSEAIYKADILAIPGGFSAGDEPDGSGKFIANILKAKKVSEAIDDLRKRKGLIIGICNGFQALIKSGLLPYGNVRQLKEDDPTLFRNDINAHVARYVNTKVVSNNSPWLQGLLNEVHAIPISHGEGKFMASQEWIDKLKANGQIAFQYVDDKSNPTMDGRHNPNGSVLAIEGITSEDGLILGKMGHSERYEENIAKNIYGNKDQNLFKNAIRYFKGEFK